MPTIQPEAPLHDLAAGDPALAVRWRLDAPALERLRREYWISTVGDLLQALLNMDVGTRTEEALGLPRPEVDALARELLDRIPEDTAAALQAPFDFATGALLEEAPLEAGLLSLARAGKVAALPAEWSLVDQMPAVVDQGRRGTCVACAATGVHEWYQRRTGRPDPLSIQHLYYRCKQRDEHDGAGTYISLAVRILDELGQCPEAAWPYHPWIVPGNEGQGPPPPGAARVATEWRVALPYAVDGQDLASVKLLLAGFEVGGTRLPGRPLLFGVPLFGSIGGDSTRRTGKVLMPFPGDRRRGGHAMALVGYRDGDGPGGGCFILRNSWGLGWGSENPDGAGHGHLPYAYLERYCGRDVYACFDEEEARLLAEHGLTEPVQEAGAPDVLHLGTGRRDGRPVLLPARALSRHLVTLGSTGSGKTAFCKLVCERALALGIPVIAVDPQGDVASMATLLPEREAREHGLDPEMRRVLRDRVEPIVFTPESPAGIPICANPFASAATPEPRTDPIRFARYTDFLAEVLVGHLKGLSGRKAPFFQAALASLVRHGLTEGRLERLEDLVETLLDPPAELGEQIGSYLDPRDLEGLRRSCRVLLESPARYLFDFGVPLDVDLLIGRAHNPEHKTRLSILYLNSLTSQADKEYFVSLLAENLYQWMLHNPQKDTARPQLILWIDEIGMFVPNPTQKKPICKDALVTLFKQGRKYGLACMGASQSPSDCDYRALGQANTLAIGLLKTRQEFEKIARLRGEVEGEEPAVAVTRFQAGEFYLSAPDVAPQAVHMQATLTQLGLSTLAESEVPDLVSPEVRQRFLRWCQVPSPRVGRRRERPAAEPDRKPAPQRPEAVACGQDPERATPRARQAADLAEAVPVPPAEELVVEALATSPRALTLRELEELVADDGGDRSTVREAVHDLIGHREVLQERSARGVLHFLPHQGYLPEAGLLEQVLVPATLPVSERRARRLVSARFSHLERQDRRLQLSLVSYPIWRVEVAYRRSRLLGLRDPEGRAVLLVDAVDRLLVLERGGALTFHQHLDRELGRCRDLLAAHDLRPTAPGLAALLPANYRRLAGRAQVCRVVEQAYGVQVVATDPVFLPVWLGVARPYRRKEHSVRCVDAVLGAPFSPRALPDLRSLR